MCFAKEELRKHYLSLRRNQDKNSKLKNDSLIFVNVKSYLIKHQEFKKIGIYFSNDEEVDTLNIINWLLKNRYEVYINKVINKECKIMQFSKINTLNFEKELIYKKIVQPSSNEFINKNELDVIFIPVVLYDQNKNRIGMGKAYYDNFLKDYYKLKVGLAYKMQFCNINIQTQEHDEKLDLIINEYGAE